ncbi:MAG TPA: hypothetical protein DHW42_05770 [Candidatus Marinimicrobia bacterium]|nr:hypothetical protein [Candidatus Neomarinimicrobiota bacterium]
MKNFILIVLLAGAFALVLGIITQLIGHAVIITAAGWNGFAQSLVLLSIGAGILEHLNKK